VRYDGAQERRAWILSTLRTTGFLSIADLAADLGVSDMTIRRDLRLLERTGEVRTVRGGVSLRHGTLRTSDFLRRAGEHAAAKRAIASTACTLVQAMDTIAIDSGTANYEVATALGDGFTGSVVTTSVPVIQLMLNRPRTRVIALGGELLVPSQAFAGPMTVEAASRVRVRVCFLGAVAVDDRGAYVNTDVELPTKRALMEIADEVALLVNYEKFEHSAPVRLCTLAQLTHLVTDRTPPPRMRAALRKARVNVLIGRPASEEPERTA